MTRLYKVFGLVFSSQREIAALTANAVEQSTAVDVSIVDGDVPEVPDARPFLDLHVAVRDGICIIAVDEVGRFRVQRDLIVFDRYPDATDHQVDAYLLGSAFGTVLHLRDILPLHSNGIVSNGMASLICGASGAGKSTLAAHCAKAGFDLVSDDLCAVVPGVGDGLVVHPGIPRLKLWDNSLRHLQLSHAGAREVPWAAGKFELANGRTVREACPVSAIYVLPRVRNERRLPFIERVGTLASLNALTSNIYRRPIADMLGKSASYLSAVARIAEQVPVFQINRQWGLDNFDEEAEVIIEHLAAGHQIAE